MIKSTLPKLAQERLDRKSLSVPVLTKTDLEVADRFRDNCGPVSITALIGQPYDIVHNHCKTYDWCEEEGICIVDILLIIRDFGHRTKFLKKESEKYQTLSAVFKRILKPGKKYLIGTKGHVLAWIDGVVVDSYGCAGNTKVLEIIEIS